MAAILPAIRMDVNYDESKERIKSFLSDFKTTVQDLGDGDDMHDQSTFYKYPNMLQNVANREDSTIMIALDDLKEWEETTHDHTTLLDEICNNTARYIELFSQIIDEMMPEPTKDISYKDEVLDVILHQRQQKNQRAREEQGNENVDPEDMFPPQLTRRYYLYFKPLTDVYKGNGKAMAVREIKGQHLGHLLTVRGIVTRVSDVKPAVQVNAYTCDKCGDEIFQEVKSRQFAPLVECPSKQCQENNVKGQLFMSTRASKFLPYQDVKVQELADQVPVGHIPRSLTVHITGDLVRTCNPGDVVDLAGVFLPTPYTGFKALKAGLLTDTYLEAQHIRQHKTQYDQLQLTDRIIANIEELKDECGEGGIYTRLAMSIAPEIWGHLDVKKALLLQLVGGVTKEVNDGMKIRGDINLCLVGDPGVAKSQLLKYITKIAPRGVYTTGRGSSGVGLTAAVMRDPVSDEMVLEGGALVLADNGVCCIDEFDKMDDNDRTAIHEVMEQQTISISKAGMSTTLNARTSILAAANPVHSRYNPKISPVENINLPAALLSRFDLMFLMLDKKERESDERLASHVAYVHMHNEHPQLEFEPLSPLLVRQYIARARQFRPVITQEISEQVVTSYVKKRQQQKAEQGTKKQFSHITPRTLLGVLRLSQALARLRFSNEVITQDVDEALRLMDVCRESLNDAEGDKQHQEDTTNNTKIYRIISEMARATGHDRPLDMAQVRQRVLNKGFTEDHLTEAIREYEGLSLFALEDDMLHLTINT